MRLILIFQIIELVLLTGALFLVLTGHVLAGSFFLCCSLLLVILLIVLVVHQNSIMNFLLLKTKEKQKDQEKEEHLMLYRKTELAIFESQINPHFLYNTLDSIRGQALSCGQDEIASMTERLSNFFRYCISSRSAIVKISEELRNIDDYYAIQKYRFGDRIQLTTSIEDPSIREYYIPKLSLQPLVENAIAHGIENSAQGGIISIHMLMTPKKIYIYVRDNGGGMSAEDLNRMNERLKRHETQVSSTNSRHTGIAIQNVNARIKLCFGEEYGMHYHSIQGQGTQVEIVLPKVDDFTRGQYEHRMQEVG